ncbi:hypothetical protein QNH14_03540 [Apirhabdus apintestini]|uniref:hypothetical protein n=1 Tax=Erwinia sp. HR93 TaxID=3094840 RepID=UPI002ADEADA0|nr:hypothetical protein [Erwinia sp. HR93]MEA1063578.1 hypothetical protein [Erwinia sp. HR93]WPM85360.1 hypothetical protein QNH14_03540 [Enterobacteriaceae bacterium CA-0114]
MAQISDLVRFFKGKRQASGDALLGYTRVAGEISEPNALTPDRIFEIGNNLL